MHQAIVRSFECQEDFAKRSDEMKQKSHRPQTIDFEVNRIHQNLKMICDKPIPKKTVEDACLLLKTLELFQVYRELKSSLDDMSLLVLAFSLKFKEFMPMEILCRLGETPSEVFYILDGKVAVTNLASREISLDSLDGKVFHYESKGSVVGEASILYNSNRYD